MKARLTLLLTVCIVALPATMNGQVGNLLKNKLKAAAATEAEKKEEKKSVNLRDRLVGSIVGEADTLSTGDADEDGTQARPRNGNPLSGLLGGGANVPHRDVYKFDASIVMLMEIYEKGEKEASSVVEYTTYISTGSEDVAIEIRPVSGEAASSSGGAAVMQMIYDKENNCMLMLTSMGTQNTAIASNLDEALAETEETEEDLYDTENPTYTKTGETKMISGYKCDGYLLEDGENRVKMWVTKDVPFKASTREMRKAGVPAYYEGPFDGGMIMEMESFENDVRTMTMTVKDISDRANKSIPLTGYTFMNLNMGGK